MADLAKIEKYLKSLGVSWRTVDLGGKVFRVDQVIDAGVSAEEIVKTLIVKTNHGFVALALRGKDRVDFKKVRRLFGSKSQLAKPEEVGEIAGVPVGAVCPVAIEVPLIFDRKVMELERVNLGSGDLTKGLEMNLTDLLKAVGDYKVENLV